MRAGGGPAELVERRDDDAHHAELVARAAALAGAAPGPVLVLTGKAQTIRAVRHGLRAAGLHPVSLVKAHWGERRRGLD